MKYLLLSLIRLYQATLSPDHSWLRHINPHGYCRFYPTCSEYAHQAIDRRGVMMGTLKSAWRLMRCHPWHPGGMDPVN